MASNTTHNSTSPEFCVPSEDYQLFNQISLGPALLIILVLVFMKRRAVCKLDCWDGRPGILSPIDSLGSEENRFSYALAYAAMGVAITILFINKLQGKTGQVVTLGGPQWVTVFDGIVSVILLGIIFLPMFLSLSTHSKLLGSAMGFAYTAMRLVFLFVVAMRCPLDKSSVFPMYPLFFDLPTMAAHVFLLGRFLVIFVMEIRKAYRKQITTRDLWCGTEADFTVNPQYVAHVRTLLQGKEKPGEEGKRKWYVKGRNFIYTPDPDFKYSITMLSTVIVSGIIIYEFVILFLGQLVGVLINIRRSTVASKVGIVLTGGQQSYDELITILDIIIVTFLVSSIVSALYMYFQMYRMLVAHRHHVIKLMKSDRTFLPKSLPTPDDLVGLSLRYCGYQIAYFLWGYIIMVIILTALVLLISLAIVILPSIMTPEMTNMILGIVLGLVPAVAMAIAMWLMQKILAVFVFKDRSMDSKVVNINNRRCFLLLSFFFFFFNILVGLMSCVLRILKGMLLGILFIGRIDRPLLMKGFTKMDTAYMAYIGYLHLQVAHKHPVVLVYCHLLWEEARKRRLKQGTERFVFINETSPQKGLQYGQELSPVSTYPRVSAWALNKWFVAVTIIHNPSLVLNRKGFLRNIIGLEHTNIAEHQDTNGAVQNDQSEQKNSVDAVEIESNSPVARTTPVVHI